MSNVLYDGLIGNKRDSDKTFLILGNGGSVTYRAFLGMAAQFAGALQENGLRPGDRLVMQVAKSPAALAVYVACLQMGVVFLPLNTAYTAEEVAYFVGDAEPGLVVCDPDNLSILSPIADRYGAVCLTLGPDGDGSLWDMACLQQPNTAVASRENDDLAALLYTSGTTGRSKGAMLSHGNLLSNASTLQTDWHFTDTDVLLHALPIFHVHGLFVATNVVMRAGAAMIFLSSFDQDEVIRLLPEATSMMGVPTFYTRLLADERFSGELTAHMRVFISGSAPLLAETHAAFSERTGHAILERYGMTETNMIASNPYDGERRAGTVGFPLSGVEVRISDAENGAALQDGEVGLIEVRGPNVFSGYWKMAEKTAEEFRADGFFITGDMGCIDDQGYLQIIGRSKDLIISGGYNIYPKEIELLLDEQPGVLESAVVGVAHPDFGEGVVAVLVPVVGSDLDVGAIAEAIQSRLARFKQPKAMFVVDALPRNAMGKVQKAALRNAYADSFQQT